MLKKLLFLITIVTFSTSLVSCSEDKPENQNKTDSSEKTSIAIPKMAIQDVYREAKELLENGESMIVIKENEGKDSCLVYWKTNHPRAMKLRKMFDAHYEKEYFPLGASLAHLTNCTTCLNSREQCELAREFLEEANKLHKLSSK